MPFCVHAALGRSRTCRTCESCIFTLLNRLRRIFCSTVVKRLRSWRYCSSGLPLHYSGLIPFIGLRGILCGIIQMCLHPGNGSKGDECVQWDDQIARAVHRGETTAQNPPGSMLCAIVRHTKLPAHEDSAPRHSRAVVLHPSHESGGQGRHPPPTQPLLLLAPLPPFMR